MERDRDWLYPAIAIAALIVVCAGGVSFYTGYPTQPSGQTSLAAATIIIAFAATIRFLRYFYGLWRTGVENPIARIRRDFFPAAISFVPIPVGIAILSVFFYCITYLKSMIPAVIPYWADAPFYAIDRALLIDPQGIATVIAPALPALGLFYGLWHIVHLGGIVWVLHWQRDSKARHIISFMLAWSIGMMFAYLFSSMGPIFTGRFDASVAPAITQNAAAILWDNYQAHGALIGGGISAFPSMHVALAVWFALVLRDRNLATLGVAYAFGIFFCSVILGWHYVADGAAGIGIALLADWLSGMWMRRARAQQQTAIAAATGASMA